MTVREDLEHISHEIDGILCLLSSRYTLDASNLKIVTDRLITIHRNVISCQAKVTQEVEDHKQRIWDLKEGKWEEKQEQDLSVHNNDQESHPKEHKQKMQSMDHQNLNDEHAALVKALCKSGSDILPTLTPGQCHLIHMMLGISGEAGELLDAVKKSAIYQKSLDIQNIIEELGDLEFYMEGLRRALCISREEVLQQNISKLRKRYGERYSDIAAQVRADKNETEIRNTICHDK